MRTSPRSTTPARLLLGAILLATLAACGASATPSPTPVAATPTLAPAATDDPAARQAYADALCPILLRVVELDPRLADMRSAGAAGGDMTVNEARLTSLAEDLRVVLTDLDAVPAWNPGQRLRFELLTALHAIRAHILVVSDDLADAGAAEAMAAIPFVASTAMDRAFASAAEQGLTCGDWER